MAQSSYRPDRDDTDVIGARIGAQIVDSIVTAVLVFVPFFIFGALGGTGDAGAAAGLGLLGLVIGSVTALGYHFLIEGLWDGFTVGKRIFGIQVIHEDGSECSIGSALVRNLLEILDGLFYYLIGFVVMAMSDKRQRIGDRLAGTVVVRESSIPNKEPSSIDQPAQTEKNKAVVKQ